MLLYVIANAADTDSDAAVAAHIVNLCKIQVLHAVLCENLSDLTPNIQ